MTCIKTGATVYFNNYNRCAAADLYAVGDVIVIRWNNYGEFYGPVEQFNPTHIVDLPIDNNCFHREDIGITVVYRDAIKSM